jgi:hypothetical protein
MQSAEQENQSKLETLDSALQAGRTSND